MGAKLENEKGIVVISTDIIAKIAGIAANKCRGVVSMASRNTADGLVGLLKKEAGGKGIRVEAEDDSVIIDIHIVVEYGVNIPVVCQNITQSVKEIVEDMTGLKMKKINVCVDSIRLAE